jgi:pimeloyl-ACP methyl ester carboxylesterase
MLAYAYDFRPSFAGLPEADRARMTVLVAEHDLLFSAHAMEPVWEQAGVRTVAVPGEGHALAMRDPDAFRGLLLDCVEATPAR